MSQKTPVTLYLDKQLLTAIINNFLEIEEFDGLTRFKAFVGSKSQFFSFLLSLGLKRYVELRAEESKKFQKIEGE